MYTPLLLSYVAVTVPRCKHLMSSIGITRKIIVTVYTVKAVDVEALKKHMQAVDSGKLVQHLGGSCRYMPAARRWRHVNEEVAMVTIPSSQWLPSAP